MRKNQKRNLLATFVSSALLCSVFAIAGVSAGAEEVEAKDFTGIAFSMEAGASVNLSESGGIRFNATMTKADYASIDAYYDTLSYGAFIVPAAYNTEANSIQNWENFFGETPKYDWEGDLAEGTLPALQMDSLIFENEDGKMQVNGSVVGIYDKHLCMDYVGVCYVKGEKDGVATYKFATLADDQDRNMVYVAQKAIESGKYLEDADTLEGYISDYVAWYKSANNDQVPTVEYTVETYYNGVKTTETKRAELNSTVTLEEKTGEGVTFDEAKSVVSGTAYAGGKLTLTEVYEVEIGANVTMARTEENGLQLTFTAAQGCTLLVNDAVVANPYTMTVTEDTTYSYQATRTYPTELSTEKITRFVSAKTLSNQSMRGDVLIEDFSTANSMTNMSDKVGHPFGFSHSIVASTLSHKADTLNVSSGYVRATGTAKVEAKASAWASWGGATYYFAGINASDYEMIGMRVVFPDWPSSQWGANYLGLVIDGKMTPIEQNAYVYSYKEVQEGTQAGETIFGDAKAYQTNINQLCINVRVDLKSYLEAYPEANGKIEGVYFGTYKAKTFYFDEVYAGNRPDALDFDFSSPNDVDSVIARVADSATATYGIVADETATDGYALKVSLSATGAWQQIWINLGQFKIADYSSVKMRVRASVGGVINCFYRGTSDSEQWGSSGAIGDTYTEIDLIATLNGNQTADSVFGYLKCQNTKTHTETVYLYVDNITFVKK